MVRRSQIKFLAVLIGLTHCSLSHSALSNRFTNFQYALLPLLAAGNIFLLADDSPEHSNWKGGILIDEGTRDLMRGESKQTRQTAQTLSTVLKYVMISAPYVSDATADLWINQNDGSTAGQVALINTQSFLVTALLTQVTKKLVARERPYQRQCASQPDYHPDCDTRNSRVSFFSGDAALAFTGAGLICAHHEFLDLWGGDAPCYVALGLATTVALSRIVADKHYLSDILVGALVGTLSGYLLPKLVHYQDGKKLNVGTPQAAFGFSFGFML